MVAFKCDQIRAKGLRHLQSKILPLMLAGCFCHGAVMANPLDPQVVNGNATFSNQGNIFSITNSPGSIINWKSFSVAPGEITRFIQANSSSSVLNRITGQDPTKILGALQSNGRVFLINPNGILFGQGAQVNVNGLIASTLNISNQDFLAGRLHFKAGDKVEGIRNQGAISTPSGGQVYLIAPNVENSGIITSPKGDVVLAAGHSVQLVDSANPDVHVVISAPDNTALNLGQVVAASGRVGIYGALINQRGIVNANSAVIGENGKIVFKASRDTILGVGSKTTATGTGKGGDVHVLGERVGLAGDVSIDVSGQAGGGTILVGGDYHGDNPAIQNAKRTFVGSDAVLKADAIQNGDGGKVIVWSDEVTRNYGHISARGGTQGGNGGFVESSGKQTLEHHAKVDVNAPAGKGGTLLLDPAAITIIGGVDEGADAASLDGDNTFKGGGTPGTVNFADSDITSGGVSNIYQSELEGVGSNIILEAADYISTSGTFNGGRVMLAPNSNLVMRTRNGSGDNGTNQGINLTTSSHVAALEFKTQGSGTITLETGGFGSSQVANIAVGKLTTSGGVVSLAAKNPNSQIIMPAGAQIGSGGGNITLQADNMSFTSGTTPSIFAGNGEVWLRPTAASVLLGQGANDANGILGLTESELRTITTTNGSLKIGEDGVTGSMTVSGPLDLTGSGLAGNLILDGFYSNLNVNAPLKAPGTLVLSTGPGGTITQTSEGIISATALKANSDSVTLNAADNLVGVIAGSASAGDFTFRTINPLTVSVVDLHPGVSATGNVLLNSTSTVGVNQNNSFPSAIITATGLAVDAAGPVILNNTSNSIGSVAASVTGTGGINLRSSTDLAISSVLGINGVTTTANQPINVASNGLLTVGSNVNAGGGSGDVNLKGANIQLYGPLMIDGVRINLFADQPVTGKISTLSGSPVTIGGTNTMDILLGSDLLDFSLAVPTFNANHAITYRNATDNHDISTSSLANAVLNTPFLVIGNDKAEELHTTRNITVDVGLARPDDAVVFLAGGGISQTAAITAKDLAIRAGTVDGSTGEVVLDNSANQVGTVAATLQGGRFNFTNGSALSVGTVSDGVNSVSGVITNNGVTSIFTTAGNLVIASPINAGTAGVNLNVGGAISGNGVKGASLNASASGGMSLSTQVGMLSANNTGANTEIAFNNDGPLLIQSLIQPSSSSGSINVDNVGALTVGSGSLAVSSSSGAIHLTGRNALTVNGGISSESGNIHLLAYPSGVVGHGDTLTLSNTGAVFSNTGNISLRAGDHIVIANGANISSTLGRVTQSPNLNVPPPPSLSECKLNPALSGCASVLPTLNQCIATPSLNGCSVVLPTMAECTATPSLVGCSAVLPTIAQCTATPSLSGCSAVLPTMVQCIATPSLPGCSAVLPPLEQCIVRSSAPGCSVVLPTLSQCSATPATPGCSAVLPTMAQCIAIPATPGCLVVLPTLFQCSITPTLPGCSVVLPTLTQCIVMPNLTGCSAVLPTLAQCTATPNLPGCSVVLPVDPCVLDPLAAKCGSGLPPVQTKTPTNEPVNQAINSTINAVNTVNPTTPTLLPPPASQAPPPPPPQTDTGAGAAANSPGTSNNGSEDGSKKNDNPKAEKKDTVISKDSGEKKNDVVKKMYCN